MKHLGLNTYMYAPKDDFKHRAYWRDLYSVEEAGMVVVLFNVHDIISYIYEKKSGFLHISLLTTFTKSKTVAKCWDIPCIFEKNDSNLGISFFGRKRSSLFPKL